MHTCEWAHTHIDIHTNTCCVHALILSRHKTLCLFGLLNTYLSAERACSTWEGMDGMDEADIVAKRTRRSRLIENKEKLIKYNKLDGQLSISVSVCVHMVTEWGVPQATAEMIWLGERRKRKGTQNINWTWDLTLRTPAFEKLRSITLSLRCLVCTVSPDIQSETLIQGGRHAYQEDSELTELAYEHGHDGKLA